MVSTAKPNTLGSELLDPLHEEPWFGATDTARSDLLVRVCAALGAEFRVVGVESFGGRPIGRLVHVPTSCALHLIPGGRFDMGFSSEEEALLREQFPARAPAVDGEAEGDAPFVESFLANVAHIRPLHAVSVAPFLLGASPLTRAQMTALLGGPELLDEDVDGAVHPQHIDLVAAALLEHGLRLPSEAEWEYAARAGGRTLFPDGNGPHRMADVATTPFGLALLGSYAEVCADAWHQTYDGAPTDARPWTGKGPRVARGGAENLFPWQSCGEWLYLLSAERAPIDDECYFASFRPARSLFDDAVAARPSRAV